MAGAFLRMGLGARNLALGDAGTALPGNGWGIYYNPASLPFLQDPTVLTSYSHLSLDRHLNFVGFAAPLKPPVGEGQRPLTAGLGVGWINAGPGEIEGRDSDGNPIGAFEQGENAFYFSFALKLSDRFAAGFSPVVLHNSFPDLTDGESLSSTRLGFDAGLLVNPWRGLTLGAQARHINAQYRWDTSTLWGESGSTVTDKFPRIYRFGAAYAFDFGLLLVGDYETSDQDDNQIHMGGEYTLQNIEPYDLSLRAGYDDEDYALGLGFGFPVWKVRGQLDYVYQIQEVPPFDTQVISFSVSF
ncbi:MAG: hypothetical protein C4524_13225 [Candidatus Zixiibacteriota bacterium]|nr:MAG: hypothetical protein C4524_13225 [candidate division Zixibacteria bacterium]